MVSKKKRDQIRNVVGVDEWYGLVVVEESFLRETFVLVKSELEDLAARYKEWDTANKAGLQF